MATIREAIVNAFQSVQATFEEKDVCALEAKVVAATPAKPTDYAFVVARNWAIDRHRQAHAAAERLVREEKAIAEANRVAEVERLAREEFPVLYRKLAAEVTPTRLRHLQVVSLVCFEDKTDAEVAMRYPGTNRDLRYKWKQRGVDLLWPHASPALRERLSPRTRR